MSIFKQRLDRKTKIQIIAICTFFAIGIVALVVDIVFHGPLTTLLSDKERIVNSVRDFGFFAPLLYILLQILQTVAAPIPGQVVGTVGGYLFGWWGVIWTIIGSAIGFFIVFNISRKFGRKLVEKLVKKEELDKFDFIAGKHAPLILFIIFLLPGFPDDTVCYLAGLTDIPIKSLMFMIVIGRIPAVIMTNVFGASLGEENPLPIYIIVAFLALMLVLAVTYREKITSYLKKLSS